MIRALVVAVALLIATPAAAQTVVLVRHAEKADASPDPVLSGAGQARARALAAALSGAGLDHILVTPLRRTGLTAAPVAAVAGLTPEPTPLGASTEAHLAAVAARVRAAGPDETVLVVGHSNTIPVIVRALTADWGTGPAADMADCEYDRLTVLELQARTVLTARYGAPSACL